MEHSTVHSMLEVLADAPQPPTTVDITRAATAGRRTVRLRRFAVAGSAAVATAVVAIVVSVVASGTTTVAPPPQPADSSAPAPIAELPDEAPKSFDPLVQYADFGWLPDGLTYRLTRSEPTSQYLMATLEGGVPCSAADPALPVGCGVDGGASSLVELTVVPAGQTIHPAPPPAAFLSEPEPVNGRTAKTWGDPNTGLWLLWEYAPNAWAELRLVGMRFAGDPSSVARRIAESIRFGVDRPIKLPVRPTGLPAKVRLVALSVSRTIAPGSSGWSIELHYSDSGERTSLGDWPLSILAVLSSARTGDGNLIGDPTTTLDGHPARRINHLDGGKGLQVFDVEGVYLELSTHSPAMTQQLPGGLDGLFRGLEINRDPTAWR